MKKLHLTFLNSEGKKHSLVPAVAAEDLDVETVRGAMEKMTALQLFSKDDIALIQEVDSAKYVETTETQIF